MWLYESFIDNLDEAKLDSAKRNRMRDTTFGIPELRKYPLNDAKHVISAITYFNKCDPKYEKELANNILKAIDKFKMHVNVSSDNRFSKYYNKK